MRAPAGEKVSRARYERERAARHEAERVLEDKARTLYRLQQSRFRTLSVISHEIKTPLHGMLGNAQILANRVPATCREQLEELVEAGKSIEVLVDTLITLAQFDSGALALAREPVDLCAAVEKVIEFYRPMALKKNILVTADCSGLCGRRVLGDLKAGGQVLGELINNAIKFTSEGRIDIKVDVREGELITVVSDSGKGVPKEDRERIFERYYQGEDFEHRSAQGAGIGLSLVRHLVEYRGGTISAGQSRFGGTRIDVRVPIELAPAEEERTPDHQEDSLEGRRVLIVDDNVINRRLAQSVVTAGKMVPVMAENGREALDALERESFDLVLMDIQMPVMTGDEAIRRIRQSKSTYRDVPIIVITAHKIGRDQNPFENIGADRTLEKPVMFENLVREMTQVLPGRQMVA